MSKVKDAFTFTGKKRKQFNNLSPDDKKTILQTAIAAEVSNSFRDAIANAVINGEMLRNKILYDKYVKKIDELPDGTSDSDQYSELIQGLLSDIRMRQIMYEKSKKKSDGEEPKE